MNIHQIHLSLNSKKFKEFFRYGLASTIALTVDVTTLVLCTKLLNFHYLFSAALGFSLGITVIYIFSIRWVFRHRSYHSRHKEYFFFFLIGLAGLILNEVILWSGAELFNLNYKLSKIISVGLVFFFNFSLRKSLLFSSKKNLDFINK